MAPRIARFSRARSAWVLATLLLGAAAASARQAEPPKPEESWADLARRAQVVVIGKVLRVQSAWQGRKIVSTARIQPLEILKDQRPTPGTSALDVRFLGGRVGSWAQEYSHEPTLTQGETVALFLGPPRSDKSTGLSLLGEEAKLPLLRPGDPASRLKNNRRLASRLAALRAAVRAGR